MNRLEAELTVVIDNLNFIVAENFFPFCLNPSGKLLGYLLRRDLFKENYILLLKVQIYFLNSGFIFLHVGLRSWWLCSGDSKELFVSVVFKSKILLWILRIKVTCDSPSSTAGKKVR